MEFVYCPRCGRPGLFALCADKLYACRDCAESFRLAPLVTGKELERQPTKPMLFRQADRAEVKRKAGAK